MPSKNRTSRTMRTVLDGNDDSGRPVAWREMFRARHDCDRLVYRPHGESKTLAPCNERPTALKPLLSCKTLKKLTVSDNVQEALKCIEGKAAFEIRIEG